MWHRMLSGMIFQFWGSIPEGVGFLATIEREETDLIEKVASGHYKVEERMLIEASVGVESCWAVNDIVLTRGEYSRIVDIDIFCDGNPLYSLRGDGVILSTPTGSTAYARVLEAQW